MINATEKDEREYLEVIEDKLEHAIHEMEDRVKIQAADLRQTKQYWYENKSGLDEADLVALEQSVYRSALAGDSSANTKKKLWKLRESPYFARIDFKSNTSDNTNTVYIGIHSFFDNKSRTNLIYDWRAPISSMFYDFESGDAWFQSPTGKIEGQILLKRQYRIRKGRMEFMIENSMNIQDDVLQQELSRTSDDRMKNIVATIQRDQNRIVRDEETPVIIIQGVAGSGKTSIALHRIAFLLYRFKDTIKSDNILIISPNRVFADYISNVLPELGEENIPEKGMEDLASELLEDHIKFQSFFEQVSHLVEKPDDALIARIRFKSSTEFLQKINQYVIHIENHYFMPRDVKVRNNIVVPSYYIRERFKAYPRVPLLKRFALVAKDLESYIQTNFKYKPSGRDKQEIKSTVERGFKSISLFELYTDFYKWIGKPEAYQMIHGSVFEYSDVFPLIYFKMRLEGLEPYHHVKHLVIDEMQDYTPVQYAILSRLFICKKTILGDAYQSVNPYGSSSAEEILNVFPQGEVIKLNKSYRSTYEIVQFAQRISPNADIVAVERHGEVPAIKILKSNEEEIGELKQLVNEHQNSGYNTLGVICKTRKQAELLYKELKTSKYAVHYLTAESASFAQGVVITTAHLAKGLEFDEIIIPFASASIYESDIDKGMLYIGCTRAMHKLTLTCVNEPSRFVK
jgi:DNA helicase-2/ATP-dependent DNA helicase PcrA